MPGLQQIEWSTASRSMRRMIAARLFRPEPSVVDDLTQEALIRLMRIARTQDVRNVEATMRHVVYWTVGDHLRRHTNDASLDDVGEHADGDPAWAMQRAASTVLRFFESIGRGECSDRTRDLLAGLTWNDVAERDARSADAVRQEWSRCAKQFRAAYPSSAPLFAMWS